MYEASKNEIKPMDNGSWYGPNTLTDGNIP